MLGTYCEGNALLSWVHHCARPPKVCDAAASSCGHVFILIWLSSAPDSTASLSLSLWYNIPPSFPLSHTLSIFLSVSLSLSLSISLARTCLLYFIFIASLFSTFVYSLLHSASKRWLLRCHYSHVTCSILAIVSCILDLHHGTLL